MAILQTTVSVQGCFPMIADPIGKEGTEVCPVLINWEERVIQRMSSWFAVNFLDVGLAWMVYHRGFGGRDSCDSAQIELIVDKGKDVGPRRKRFLKGGCSRQLSQGKGSIVIRFDWKGIWKGSIKVQFVVDRDRKLGCCSCVAKHEGIGVITATENNARMSLLFMGAFQS